MSNVKFNPTEGQNDKKVSVFSDINEGLDTTQNYIISDEGDNVEKNIVVNQVGKREKFMVKNGDTYEDFVLSDGGTFNVLKPGAEGAAASWGTDQLPPEATESVGDKSLLPSWDFYLIDVTQNTGDKVRPVGKLCKNNLLRFENGDFAPTVGITEEMRSECDVELYLDNNHSQKYCDAGAFDAKVFYDKYGVNQKLYNILGDEVRVLRPWETTSTNYTIGFGCNKGLYVVDKIVGKSGKIWSGVYDADTIPILDGVDLRSVCPYLPPTALSPGPVCTIGSKSRSFFYLYEGETNCKSGAGISNVCTMFLNGRTYPRCNDINQINIAKYARANNVDPESSYPFSEGGFLTLNAYILYLEMLYGTKFLISAEKFGSGISSNSGIGNDTNYRKYGGVKYRKKGQDEWMYGSWASQPSIIHYEATKTTNLSNYVNGEYPKEQCMESQMAASYAFEIGIEEGAEFDFYGGKYWYKNVPGAKGLSEGYMNVIVFKEMTGTISALDDNDDPAEFDLEVILRMSLFGGMNLSGDVFRYCGGGYEQVGTTINDPNVTRIGNPIDIYIEPDQKKWIYEKRSAINKGEVFDFESKYKKIATTENVGDGTALHRIPYTAWKDKKGGSLGTGECFHSYDNCYWASTVDIHARVAARFGGNAIYAVCSPRFMYAYLAVSTTFRYYCGLAQLLLDVSKPQV